MLNIKSFLINRRNPRNKKLLIIHVAKTAGTSLRKILQDEYGEQMVYPSDFHLRNVTKGGYILGDEIIKRFPNLPQHKVLIGHFTASISRKIPNHYLVASFVRDPVQRSLSTLAHFCRSFQKKGKIVSASDLMNDDEFLACHITDFQTRVFGAEGINNPNEVRLIDDELLKRAIRRIETLDFIGLTESFTDSCRVFDKIFSTRISRFTRHENVLRPQGTELAEHIPRIEQLVQRDRILYDAAVSRYNELHRLL
jgi:hypothetical protein